MFCFPLSLIESSHNTSMPGTGNGGRQVAGEGWAACFLYCIFDDLSGLDLPFHAASPASGQAWASPAWLMQDMEGKQREKAERLRFGRFFYRFPNGESGADVYDRMTIFEDHLIRDINAGRSALPCGSGETSEPAAAGGASAVHAQFRAEMHDMVQLMRAACSCSWRWLLVCLMPALFRVLLQRLWQPIDPSPLPGVLAAPRCVKSQDSSMLAQWLAALGWGWSPPFRLGPEKYMHTSIIQYNHTFVSSGDVVHDLQEPGGPTAKSRHAASIASSSLGAGHRYSQRTSLVLVTHGLALRVFLMRWFHWSVDQFMQVFNPPNAEVGPLFALEGVQCG